MAAYVMSERTARYIRGLMSDRQPPAPAPTSTRQVRPQAIQEDEFAAPFAVRWATSEGGWIVWLPSAECLMVGSAPVDAAEFLDAAESYPGGWYKLSDIGADATAVYLNVTPPIEEDDEAFAEFSEDPTGDENWAILIATMSGKAVRQNVDSAIILDAGVRSLNGMSGHLLIEADPDASVLVDDKEIYAKIRTEAEEGTVFVGIADRPPDDDDDDGNYCNNITNHNAETLDPPNDISDDDGEGGGGLNGEDGPDNTISRWPCRNPISN